MYFEEIASINFEEVFNVCIEGGLKLFCAILIVLLSVTFALMVWEFMKDVAAKSLELLGRNRPEDEIQSSRPKRARSQRPRRGKSQKPKKSVTIISENVNAGSADIVDVNG